MKILMVGLSSNNGGIETSIIESMKIFKQKGYEVDIIESTRKELAFKSKLKDYKIIRISNYYDFPNKYCEKLFEILKNNNYDYIYINILSSKHLEPIQVAEKFNNIKIIIHAHDIEKNTKKTKNYLTKISYKRFACSKEAGDSFFINGNYEISVPLVENKFKYDYSIREQMRQKYNVENKIVIGQIGKFCEAKNQMFSVELLEQLLKKNKNYVLFLVGKIDENIEKKIKDKNLDDYIILTGMVANTEDYYNLFDIFVFPSKKEAYGICVVEAQNFNNLLIIASDNVTKETNVSGKVKYLPLNYKLWINAINTYNLDKK